MIRNLFVLSLTIGMGFSPLAAASDEALHSEHLAQEYANAGPVTPNEPVYFVIGGGEGADIKARFQFSFKYRIFDPSTAFIENHSWLRDFHFAYTQTSLWNLSEDSAPFEDTSYKPSFFWDVPLSGKNFAPAYFRAGYEHESNGQADEDSRSIDTLFFWPIWSGKLSESEWIIAPKLYGYLTTGNENKDIADYRGYADLWVRFGRSDGWLYSLVLRKGTDTNITAQFDVSYPVKQQLLSRTGGFIYMQIFNGYGESILNYNYRDSATVRIGYAIVR